MGRAPALPPEDLIATITRPPASGAARLLGVGAYRPRRRVDNDEVCALLDVDADWVATRSGIRERRFAAADETLVAMSAAAAREALAASGLDAADIGTTLVATMSADTAAPQVATRVAHEIGATAGPAMDLGGACAGFCYALEVAAALVAAGSAGHVLVVGAERMTDIVDPTDRSTAFIFGDGAGAVVVGPSDEPGIGPVAWGADGGQCDLIAQSPTFLEASRSPGPVVAALRMQGPAVFRWATTRMVPLAEEALEEAGMKAEQLAAFVPHQANARITSSLRERLGLPAERVADTIAETGNTSAATLPLAFQQAADESRVPADGTVLFVAFGAGFAWGAALVHYGD